MATFPKAILTFPQWEIAIATTKDSLLNPFVSPSLELLSIFFLWWSILWMFLHDGHMLPSTVSSLYFSEDQKHLSALITKSFPAGMPSRNGHWAAIQHW